MNLSLRQLRCLLLKMYVQIVISCLCWCQYDAQKSEDVGIPTPLRTTTTLEMLVEKICSESFNIYCTAFVDEKIRDHLGNLTTSPEGYNARLPPPYVFHPPDIQMNQVKHKNTTTKLNPWIKLVMLPLFVTKMPMKLMEFSIEFTLRVTWEDGRFQKPKRTLEYFIPDAVDIPEYIKKFEHSPDLYKRFSMKLWIPTMKFINCKGENVVLTDPNVDLLPTQITLQPWIQRLTMYYKFSSNFFCQYTFIRYPFDQQRCSVQVSYAHTNQKMNWITEVVAEDLEEIHVPPEYRLISVSNTTCPSKFTEEQLLLECAEFVFVFHRIYDQHIMLLFIPSMLIVCLSWISFWLDESAAPPRVALGLTSLLTLSTQFNNAQKDLPSVADIKAIDIWMFACMIMVFLSLVEFAIANFSYRRQTKQAPQASAKSLTEPKPANVFPPKYVYSANGKPKIPIKAAAGASTPLKVTRKWQLSSFECCSWSKGNKIDVCSRIIFPLAFLTFNIVFWTHYVT